MTTKKYASDPDLVRLLKARASRSSCTYRVAAAAFDKKGQMLGHAVNRHAVWNVLDKTGSGRRGTAKHAEKILCERYAGVVKTIVIARVGRGGLLQPIDPCPACRKTAEKLGVRIVSVKPS